MKLKMLMKEWLAIRRIMKGKHIYIYIHQNVSVYVVEEKNTNKTYSNDKLKKKVESGTQTKLKNVFHYTIL